MKNTWKETVKGLKKEVEKLKKELKLSGRRDPLTKAWNCTYFHDSFNSILKDAKKFNSIFSVAIVDIDDFKEYNDARGHQAGDAIIKKAANILKNNCSTCDIVSRCGGEEFIIIFPKKEAKASFKILERARKEFEKFAKPKIKGLPKKLTISAGISSYPKNGSTKMQLLKKADLALYDAKKRGKNKVSIYSK